MVIIPQNGIFSHYNFVRVMLLKVRLAQMGVWLYACLIVPSHELEAFEAAIKTLEKEIMDMLKEVTE